MGDVKAWTPKCCLAKTAWDALVDDYLIAAMHVNNVLHPLHLPDQLIVTPGDRAGMLLAAIASRLTSSTPDIAGVLLTGGIRPAEEVCKFIEGWTASPAHSADQGPHLQYHAGPAGTHRSHRARQCAQNQHRAGSF